MSGVPFDFELPVDFFEKAGEDPGKQRRIGGLVSVQTKDRQNEIILQNGLDFSDFLHNGWFNDNHSKATDDILGYPEATQFIRKGQTLPTGTKAIADGHWVEGYLLGTEKAEKIWKLGKALAETKRRLGFSVEGKILQRTGSKNQTIAKALVRNVAITNCPVNTDSKMEILVKSLQTMERAEPSVDDMRKMLGMGTPHPGVAPEGPKSGMGAGEVLVKESLETNPKLALFPDEDEKKKKKKVKKVKKSMLTDGQAYDWFKSRLPNATPTQLVKLIDLTRVLKDAGKL